MPVLEVIHKNAKIQGCFPGSVFLNFYINTVVTRDRLTWHWQF